MRGRVWCCEVSVGARVVSSSLDAGGGELDMFAAAGCSYRLTREAT